MHGLKGDCIKIAEPSTIKANRSLNSAGRCTTESYRGSFHNARVTHLIIMFENEIDELKL